MYKGADLGGTFLWWADFRGAFLDSATVLSGAIVAHMQIADTRWGGVNLGTVAVGFQPPLGDEEVAHRSKRVDNYKTAVRANRQLAVALRDQGLHEEADRFAYRAQVLQRQVLRRQRKYGRAFGSWFLDVVAGYGYKPMRSFVTYGVTILLFAVLYWCVTNDVSLTHGLFTHAVTWLGMAPPSPTTQHLQGYEAVVVSLTSFHGRGFFQPVQSPGDKVAILAAVEAAVGLLIEITFIATFTNRFFAR
jgi:hypothetical protein